MNKAISQIFTAILVLGLFCGAVNAAPSVSGDATPALNSTVTWTVGTTQTFSIPFNETTTVTWNVNGQSSTTQTDSSNIATLSHTVQLGSYQVTASVEGLGQISAWTVNGVTAVPVITLSDPSSSSVTDAVGGSRTFTATVDQTVNMTWYLDDVKLQENSSVTTSSYSNTSATQGSHTIRVEAQNGNGTADSKSWTWAVGSSTLAVDLDPSNEDTVTISQGESKTFYVNSSTSNQNVTVEWYLNDVLNETDTNVESAAYGFAGVTAGSYTIKAVINDPNGAVDSLTKTWTVEVGSSSSGNRIWQEGMPTTYTWTAQSYSGFYYDLNTGVSSEEMTITDIDRSIDSGNIEYVTRPTETDFEYGDWGSYEIIGFMGDKYFAGYTSNNSSVIDDDVSPISDGILSKILTDNDDKESANSGDSLTLEEGYSLNIKEVDVNGESVWVQLEKDGDVVDEGFVTSGDDYVYEADLGESEDVPIIIVHFGTVFAGTETSAVFIQGIFQISDEYTELSNGDTFGEMEVTSLSSNEIKMKNDDSVGLDEGDTVDLMGKVQIQVADDSTLRFAPILDTSESGTYELRGTVYEEGDALPTWTPFNFEGFYYNIDEGIGTENLTVEEFGSRDIPSGKLVYKSTPQSVDFEHDEWGNFTVVGFMADKYFAGYTDGSVDGAVDDVSLLSDSILCKVLTDTDDKESMNSGSALALEDGYSLSIKEVDVNGESVWVQLEKDGEVVDEGFVTSGEDYIYETELGESESIPLIIVHFGTVFAGTETSAVFVQGIFQLSDDYTEINNGDTFGEMEVTSVSESGITMKNDDDIGLGQDETVEVMGNVSFKTADSSTLRFYPFVQIETGGEGNSSSSLKINVPDEIYAGDSFNIEVTAGGEPVEGAEVTVNETSAGTTDDDGVVEYTAEEVGSLKITAEKDDYKTANKNIDVSPQREGMTLNVSSETAYIGDTITIEALKKIGGDPIESVNVSVDNKAIGSTDSEGKITYVAEESGTFKISAVKEGFTNESTSLKVKELEAVFEVSNLVIDPIEVKAGKNTTITANVENVGNAAGDYNAELSVNGSVVDSQNVSLGVGENSTISFEHSEENPGTYNVVLGEQTATYTVKEKSSLLLYVLGVFVLLIIGGAAYFFTKGGGDITALQQKVQELIYSIKPRR